jgi:hypothetical protein
VEVLGVNPAATTLPRASKASRTAPLRGPHRGTPRPRLP